ncbi:DEAD/DEAH box helicase [Streptomyces albus]|uniref:DEAD/DEAH box helicase n=1 Tax=Streptomyces albus TaxID=1888 RepID=UPI0004C8D6B1|nr:DEAD/DEAH box helicase [Streptomyces albus]
MRPTLEAEGLKESLLQYLSTTYALTDEGARKALHRFLGDDNSGMFRGPFLRVRTPFVTADPSWETHLDWRRTDGWTPYEHQAAAFERLSSAGGRTPRPTLVTTGTGSGKTESFLYPVLDHCARERAAGRAGVKAVLLYPMNALATDQAQRINGLLTEHPELHKIRAGLYIGDRAATRYGRVFTARSDMQVTPPDILITNYKMLDLLLQRAADAPLWDEADIRYVVVDEFHSYDGAQATDVAMLLRRLASAVGASEKGRPLGRICPVATSATLASGTDEDGLRQLLDVATQVFGTEFPSDAILGEKRLSVDQFVPRADFDPLVPIPSPDELAALPDPTLGEEEFAALAEAVTGSRDTDPHALGEVLKRHPLTSAVLHALDGQVRSVPEVLDLMWRSGAQSWGRTITLRPEVAAKAFARLVALLSVAHDPASAPEMPRPFVQVEVHQWARSVSRLVRGVLPWPKAEFQWDAAGAAESPEGGAAGTAPVTTATAGQNANLFLPAVYCRDCGRSGWAVFTPESDDLDVEVDTHKIRRASVSQDKMRVRNLIAATDGEAMEGSGAAPMDGAGRAAGRADANALSVTGAGQLRVLDGPRRRLRLPDPVADYDPETGGPRLAGADSAFVLVFLGETATTAAEDDWCPACGTRNAIRFLGTGAAALAAASVTQLFTGGELDERQGETKTLMFNDSVQDAAHRAGFVASRSYTFSLRALFKSHLSEDAPTALNDLIADVVAATTDRSTLAAVVPTDLHDVEGVKRLLSGKGRGGDRRTWELIGERFAFEALMEFGFRSRNGRTLELTRTAAAQVRISDPVAAAAIVRAAHTEPYAKGGRLPVPDALDDARYLGFLRIFLERLRTRGAIGHRWLEGYLREAGTSRYHIWGGRPPGMRAFPKGIAAPVFLLNAPKTRSEFDFATGRLSWYERWAQRALGLPREQAAEFWSRLLPALVTAGLLAVRTPEDSGLRIYGLKPGAVDVQLLKDDEVGEAFVRCPSCFWEQTVHPALLGQWDGQKCPAYRCRTGRLVAGTRPEGLGRHQRDRDYREDYYRRLYRKAGTYQVVTAEHTGMLTRPERERVEAAFRDGSGFKDPNVLSCTPTLEMGIDIGDLSAVVLAALPRRPANYAQQTGRAGRRTGNAFLLTIPDRSRRDLYYLDQPREMIAGRIVPPGSHLSAIEILRRQYVAHLLDLAARGRLRRPDGQPLAAIPREAPALFGPSGYLADLVEAAIGGAAGLVEAFLGLFPAGITPKAADELRAYAAGGLRGDVERAARRWKRGEEELRRRLNLIDEAVHELHEDDAEQRSRKAELEAEHRAVGKRLMKRGLVTAQQALCDLGLLPNYALIDAVTTLNATLYWPTGPDPETGRERFKSTMRPYERPRRYALSELAPGNTFYVGGYKHQVTGIEIGSSTEPDWALWRFCRQCGYVRTENAAEDRGPCPRCHSTGIADDGSCLHQVIEPTVVTSRGKRDDARIGDDKDEREQRFYTVIDAVDIPAEHIETGASWRHARETFGVDYSRKAVIRRINVGPLRFDARPEDELAGNSVRLAPFHVCTACGAATADGRPVFDHDTDALDTSAARNPAVKHHQPWCPLRRGRKGTETPKQEPVLLAHQLTTEALRILLPAATVLVDEKVHSFRAALRLGVDRHFGGDPAHLDTTLASMPDKATGERRHFLVLYDRLPGGTGYLDRLTRPDAFRDTLAEARRVLIACPCKDEGRRACHRCLHRHTEERHQDDVSRRAALELVNSLLGPVDEHGRPVKDDEGNAVDHWQVENVPTTAAIGLDRQVESDLEARFLAALRTWSTGQDDASLEESGTHSGNLRFAGAATWRLTAQRDEEFTRTDFTFERTDGSPQKVHVFLDGHRYHATREHNRIADDCRKRDELRAGGALVFQITWDDLELFETGERARARPVWPPYRRTGQEAAKDWYEQLGGNRAHLAGAVFGNPIDTLLGYLRDPSRTRWGRRAGALVGGLLSAPEPLAENAGRAQARETLRGALRSLAEGGSPAAGLEPAAGDGEILVLSATDEHGLALLYTVHPTAGPDGAERVGWGAIAVLDDHDSGRLGTPEHKLRWRSWLYWSNLLQFLSFTGGDGVQLATSRAAGFPVEILRVGGGAGELESLSGRLRPEPAAEAAEEAGRPERPEPPARAPGGERPASRPAASAPRSSSLSAPPPSAAERALREQLRDAAWDEDILGLLEEDEPDSDLTRLARHLAERGKKAPVFGYELGDRGWPADFAWPGSGLKIAVVMDAPGHDGEEGRKRDAAYAGDGWTVHTAAHWLDHLDTLLDLLPDTEGPIRR